MISPFPITSPDVVTASRVVVGGRGVGSKEEFQKVYALADKLGAAGVDCDGL